MRRPRRAPLAPDALPSPPAWPLDGEPRFKVSSVTGYTSPGGNNSHLGTEYMVLDRAECHAIVYETKRRSTAQRIAAELNASDDAYSPWLVKMRHTRRRLRELTERDGRQARG